ncbi:Transmembrane 9 superfamily member 5 [Euphorbia peplus]|nr:Transmembrane 9 superfamily member 5 [Euphorbia peplus]
MKIHLLIYTIISFSIKSATSSPADHRYNVGHTVPLFVNKIGPLQNPSETYEYYDLPFCRPDNVILKQETLGEVLNGDRLSSSLYNLKFREDKTGVTICNKKLNLDDIMRFRDAILNEFYFQMYIDDLPLWGFIGKVEEQSWVVDEKKKLRFFLFKHVQFDVLYNGDRVIEVSGFSDPNHSVDITEDIDVDVDVEFTYSVLWNGTSASFESRMNRYSRASLMPRHQQIHWFSFVNSVVIILLLMGLLTGLFMRRLKNDLRKCSSGDNEEDKEVGWKYIHGDVFRHPQNMSLFCAVLGTGTQLLAMVCFLFILAFSGVLYPYSRGALCTSFVLVYALTSVVGGYSAASFHCQFTETGWKKSVLLTGILYLAPSFLILSFLNTIAVSYGATAALPFGTIMAILVICTFSIIPLLTFGGLIGYKFRSEFQAPSATKKYPREIPPLGWYRKTPFQMFLAGLLTCSAIVLELHHLYASLWSYKIYTLPSILLVTLIILVLITSILSIGMTYIQLSAEDHQWWWRSTLCGGSPAIFMFSYSIFFFARSTMNGLLQLSFFIGYNACVCYAIFLMLASIGFRASFVFVSHIYHAIKSE